MVSAMDQAVGDLVSALKSTPIWDNTLFIFSTDNGGPLADAASNYPLRGGKATLWEVRASGLALQCLQGGVRGVGFINGGVASGLSSAVRGSVNHQLMHVSDWVPTLCEVAGCAPNGTLDGVSAWRHLSEPNVSSLRSEIVHDIYQGKLALRLGDFKLVLEKGMQSPQLFDVIQDAAESLDLASSMPAKVKQMLQRVEYWNSSAVGDIAQQLAMPVPEANPHKHNGVWKPWEGHG
eukprot:TRINITY_DN44318_c0_g1_i2.p1 TRINITY_DN44318_c0_g1~~TRINITY_DN44318_c0_g1_i2.p1  ORF type:complete len:235 (+),score=58.54 TRINITY_DN44318_c0_g1_i2:873-1577(+)